MSLSEQIIRCHREGLTQEATFHCLCAENELPPLRTENLSDYFKYPLSTVLKDVDHEYSKLLPEIYRIFKLVQNTISVWPYIQYATFYFLNPRYALIHCDIDDRSTLNLLDNYYGEMKQIDITGLDLKSSYDVNIVDSEYLLLTIRHAGFALMRLDLPNLTCTLLDHKNLKDVCDDFIFDCNDRHHFVIFNSESFVHCKIENSKLELGEIAHFGYTFPSINCERLVGDRIQALDRHYIDFVEYDLASDNQNHGVRRLFRFEHAEVFQGRRIENHRWSRDICYIICFLEMSQIPLLCVFDFGTRKMCHVRNDLLWPESSCMDINLDNDGTILTVCSQEMFNDHFVRRLALRSPETLVNLAFLKMRSAVVFYGNLAYKQFTANFPPSLRPFSICNEE